MARKEDILTPVIMEIVKSWQREAGDFAEYVYQGDVAAILCESPQDGPRGRIQRRIIKKLKFTADVRDQIMRIKPHLHQNLGSRFKRLHKHGYLDRSRALKAIGLRPVRWKLTEKEYHPRTVEDYAKLSEQKRIAEIDMDDLIVNPTGTIISIADIPNEVRRSPWTMRWLRKMEDDLWQRHLEEYEQEYCGSRIHALIELDRRIQKALVAARIRKVELKDCEYTTGNWEELEEKRAEEGRLSVPIPREYSRRSDDYRELSLSLYSYVLQQALNLPRSRFYQLRQEAISFIKYPLITLDLNKLARTRNTLAIMYLDHSRSTWGHKVIPPSI